MYSAYCSSLRREGRFSAWLVLAVALVVSLPMRSALPEGTQFDLNGSNTFRAEHYVNKGDAAASPFPFEDTHWFDELNLGFNLRSSPFKSFQGQVFGVYNESDYRSDKEGIAVERWNLLHENGEAALPYRAEAGDFFSSLSSRTQSRTLKGGQVELQPQFQGLSEYMSFLVFAGANQPSWRDFEANEDYSTGFSWLLENTLAGDYSFNYVFNSVEPDPANDTLRRDQQIISLAGEKEFGLANQVFTLEGELAHFFGDHEGLDDAESGQNRDENGYFAQLGGKSDWPLTYRLRYENYGQDFRPNGAIISPDRTSYESHLGWQFEAGQQLRARYQLFRDGVETDNRTDSDVFGMGASGPLLSGWVDDLTGNLDAFHRRADNRDLTTNSSNTAVTLNLNKPFGEWNVRPGVFFQKTDNGAAAFSLHTYQFTLGADHALSVLGFDGSISPGVVLRLLRGGESDSDDLTPTLAVNLGRGPHTIGLNISYASLQPDAEGAIGTETYTIATNYGFNLGSHSIGLEFNYTGRHPGPQQDTDAYMVALFWTYNFGKTFGGKGARAAIPGPAETAGRLENLRLLAGLQPGQSLTALQEAVTRSGVRGETKQPGVVVYEARLIKEIDQRQRLALVHDDAGNVQKSALIIDFENVGNLDTTAQTFEKVRKEMVDTYGRPTTILEEGQFTANLADDVNSNRFIRVYEWTTTGGILRFGIPKRLDGNVRMEIQHAAGFPSPRNLLWSVNEVR